MASNTEIKHEASKITHQAELGRQSDLQNVNHELQQDMKNYSASDYNKLLDGIKQQNGADVKANSHLPNLELYDSAKSNLPDSVKANYSDGTSMTANGQQNTDIGRTPIPGSGSDSLGHAAGAAGGGAGPAGHSGRAPGGSSSSNGAPGG